MEFMRAAIDASQQNVTGEARVRLYKGSVRVLGRRSPVSLYSEDLVTFEEDQGAYDQADAGGFIRLWGLPTGVHAHVHPQVPDATDATDGAVAELDQPPGSLPDRAATPSRPAHRRSGQLTGP
jgi:hypothetical protein